MTGSARILVIDDDEDIRMLLRRGLEAAGYQVFEAENGRVGMELQRRHRCDLVVTDLIMPDQEGLETIAALRREFARTPVIAISGGGRIGPEAYLPAARELGAVEVFRKPFRIKELLQAVADLLRQG